MAEVVQMEGQDQARNPVEQTLDGGEAVDTGYDIMGKVKKAVRDAEIVLNGEIIDSGAFDDEIEQDK